MSQSDFGNITSPQPGANFFDNKLEPWRDALHTLHRGSTRPSYVQSGMMWIDDTSTPWVLKVFQGSDDIVMGTLDPSTLDFVPSGDLEDGAVTTPKLATNAVTPVKTDTTVTALTTGSGTKTMDLSNPARSFTLTVSGGTNTLAFSNVKASGNEEIVTIRLTNGGSQTVNYPSGTQTAGGEPFPDLTVSGVDELVLKTVNGGTNWVLSYLLDVQAP